MITKHAVKKNKVILSIFMIIFLSYFGVMIVRKMTVVDAVEKLKNNHFIISYRGIYTKEAQAIADHLEENYDRIRKDLNDPGHDTIRVFVHPTQTDFNQSTGLLNSTAKGTSRGPNEFHLIWTNWFNSMFPDDPVKTAIHEYTHCVQLNILIKEAQTKWRNSDNGDFDIAFEEKFVNEYPQWFWEAICDYEAGMVNRVSVKYGMSKNPTLSQLNTSGQIYNVGYTIIEYVVAKWGKEKIPLLISSYVDIETVLGVSESEFERGWNEFVNKKY